jgi:hypothetical protein
MLSITLSLDFTGTVDLEILCPDSLDFQLEPSITPRPVRAPLWVTVLQFVFIIRRRGESETPYKLARPRIALDAHLYSESSLEFAVELRLGKKADAV